VFVAVAHVPYTASRAAEISRGREVDALCDGAAFLCRAGNRVAALALLWAAVAVDPTSVRPHRRLAAMLANAGDVDAAAAEYERFIEFVLKQGQIRRAADELAYGIAALGDVPRLHQAAAHLIPLGDIARSLSESASTPEEPAELAPFVALTGGRPDGNGERHIGHSEPPVPLATAISASTEPSAAFDEVARRVDAMGLRHVGFMSAASGEGVSTTALGTARALAGLRRGAVLLVDANWLRPSLTADAGLESASGLADYLARRASLASVVQPAGRARVAFLPIGDRAAAEPTPPAVSSFLATDAASFQTIIVDLPHVPQGEAFVVPWASSLDGLFAVVRESVTQLALAHDTFIALGLPKAPLYVINRATVRSPDADPAVTSAREPHAVD
jgi:Mrp family chromosome partitioning ATPase